MQALDEKFRALGVDHAPGQEVRRGDAPTASFLRGEPLAGAPVDFSHGDVNAFTPIPGAFERFSQGVQKGAAQAYTEYRGNLAIRQALAARLAAFTGAPVEAGSELIITPGSQGALFLAAASTIARGTRVAIVQPDYFANRKLVEFFEGVMVSVALHYLDEGKRAGIDLNQLEDAFRSGTRVFLFSNPTNPVGLSYPAEDIRQIAVLAEKYGVAVIVDELYSRLLYAGEHYTHLRAQDGIDPDRIVTIMGPSKTESMSGYRVGVAFGAPALIGRMEKLQAIVSLRAAGYNQAVLETWFDEPEGWLAERIVQHQAIRDDLLRVFRQVDGVRVRTPQAGSYLFPMLPELAIDPLAFVQALRTQARVIVTPGTEFSPHAAHGIRLNFSQDRTRALQAVERLAALIERYRS